MQAIHRFKCWALLWVMVTTSTWAADPARDALARFLTEVQSGQAVFVQRVQEPGREGRPGRVKTSSGDLFFARPHRFRLNYLKPFVQTLVADGRQLWFHDADLDQVSVRSQSTELQRTALGAIASVNHLGALEQAYRVSTLPAEGEWVWLLLESRAPDAAVKQIRLGWREGQLGRMVVDDALGHRTEWALSQWRINPSWTQNPFQFTPPPGVEVIRIP